MEGILKRNEIEEGCWSVHMGYASCAGTENFRDDTVCGDKALSCHLPGGGRAVILSDGMGKGHVAATESNRAAGMLRRRLKRGMAVDQAVKEVNEYLMGCEQTEREMFATVDLLILDEHRGTALFYKLGAAPSYIIKKEPAGGRTCLKKVEGPALPVGILPAIKLSHSSARLAAGDIIVMMSDGIFDSGWRCMAKEADLGDMACKPWMEDLLLAVSENEGPRHLAGRILGEAIKRNACGEGDDATVIVIRLR